MSVYLTRHTGQLRLFTWRPSEGTNFGDELSRVIVEWVSGRQVRVVSENIGNKLVALGTLLDDWTCDGDIVWGAGSRCTRPETIEGKRLDLRMVRGPLTRDYLLRHGFDCPAVYGDPGVVMPLAYPVRPSPSSERRYEVGVAFSFLDLPATPPIGHAIDVRWPWREVIAHLLECRRVISSSLHAIIVAEAYGIPAVWLRPRAETPTKFYDYYLSTGREIEPADTLEEALARTPPPLPFFDIPSMLAAFPLELLSESRRSILCSENDRPSQTEEPGAPAHPGEAKAPLLEVGSALPDTACPDRPLSGARHAICTIASKNYLGMVRVLARSVASTNPGIPLYVLLVDRVEDQFVPEDEPFRLITIEELDNIPNPQHFFFKYNPIELNTAAKPYFLDYLFRKHGIERLCYFDPDILLLSGLDDLWELLDQRPIVVTPHINTPYGDDRRPNELSILQAGVFNLGFVGLAHTAATAKLLAWWMDRLYRHCYMNVSAGMHVDQKWFDLVPVTRDNVFVLQDPAYNIAYWNLHERGHRLHWQDKTLLLDGKPAAFFHFSGLQPGDIEAVSKHQDRFRLADLPVLRPLFEHYRDRLHEENHDQAKGFPYFFGRFDNGVAIPQLARDLYGRSSEQQIQEFGDPFSTKGPNTFYDWLNQPERPSQAETSPSSPFSHLQMEIYRARLDLQRAFPDVQGRDRDHFSNWLATTAAREHGIAAAFFAVEASVHPAKRDAHPGLFAKTSQNVRRVLLPLRQALGSAVQQNLPSINWLLREARALDALCLGASPPQVPSPPAAASQLPFGVNVAGYFKGEFGVAEVARASFLSLRAAQIPCVVNNLNASIHRHHDSLFDDFTEESPYRVNLVHVNADMSPDYAQRRGPEHFRNRRSIGYWFWELSQFPRRWRPSFDRFQEIWVASTFCQESIARLSPIPVVKMRFPVLVDDAKAVPSRSSFGLPEDKFLFGFVFDYLSLAERKNPLGLLQAFRKAFAPHDDAVLVIKTINGRHAPDKVALLREAAKNCNVHFLDGHLSRHQMASLAASFDCFVSLHRSEGFGIGMAQAMYLGKPVIATGYSGNMDFMNHNNSFLVRYKMTELERDYGPYEKGNVWADPDLDHAAELMRQVFENHVVNKRVSAQAAHDIRTQLTVELAGAEMKARLMDTA